MAYNPAYYQANKEKYAAKSKAWREENPDRAKINRKRYYNENREKELTYSTDYNRLRKVGITREEYTTLFFTQKEVCAICQLKCSRVLAADHDHKTGKVRGLLCNKCNRGLGYFQDNPALLEQAYHYLKDR